MDYLSLFREVERISYLDNNSRRFNGFAGLRAAVPPDTNTREESQGVMYTINPDSSSYLRSVERSFPKTPDGLGCNPFYLNLYLHCKMAATCISDILTLAYMISQTPI